MTDPTSPAPSTAATSSLVEDLIDLFGSPAAVFARRAGRSPLAPFLTIVVLLLGLMFVNQGVMSNIVETQKAKQTAAALKGKNLTPEQMDQVTAQQKAVGKFAFVMIAVGIPISMIVFALIVWLVGKPFGSTMAFGTALMVSSFAWLPKVVEQIALSVQGMVLDTSTMTEPSQVSLGLARFLDHTTTSGTMLAFAGRIDPIILWCTFLLAMGYMAAGKVESKKAWIAAIVMWVLGAIPTVAGAAMTS